MIDWNPVRITPPPGWLLTYRKGESRASMACYLGDGEWGDAEGRTTVTHSTFLPPTHWAYLPEPPEEVMILPGDETRDPGPEPEIARLRAQLSAAEGVLGDFYTLKRNEVNRLENKMRGVPPKDFLMNVPASLLDRLDKLIEGRPAQGGKPTEGDAHG